MTFTKNKEVKGVKCTKFRPILLMVVQGFGGRVFFYSRGRPHVRLVNLFLSVICKDFLHLPGFLVFSYSSIIETRIVQKLIMKVG